MLVEGSGLCGSGTYLQTCAHSTGGSLHLLPLSTSDYKTVLRFVSNLTATARDIANGTWLGNRNCQIRIMCSVCQLFARTANAIQKITLTSI